MLDAGVKWLKRFPEARGQVKWSGFKNVYGLIRPTTGWARSLEQCLVQAPVKRMGQRWSPSGAQVHALIEILLYIEVHGWDRYCQMRREPRTQTE